jgi:hypothetical protein
MGAAGNGVPKLTCAVAEMGVDNATGEAGFKLEIVTNGKTGKTYVPHELKTLLYGEPGCGSYKIITLL